METVLIGWNNSWPFAPLGAKWGEGTARVSSRIGSPAQTQTGLWLKIDRCKEEKTLLWTDRMSQQSCPVVHSPHDIWLMRVNTFFRGSIISYLGKRKSCHFILLLQLFHDRVCKMDGGSCHPRTSPQHQRKCAEVWLTNTFTDSKKVSTLKKIWSALNVLLIRPNTQMFREQSSLRGALHVEAKIKTDLRIKSETKEREMALFSCLFTAVLRAVKYTKAVWNFRWNNGGMEWMHREQFCCYQKKHFTSYIIRVLNICSVATPVPCWCEHMGRGRGGISSVETGGENFCCTMQSRAGLYKDQNTLVYSVNSWPCSSVVSRFHTVTPQNSHFDKFWQVDL